MRPNRPSEIPVTGELIVESAVHGTIRAPLQPGVTAVGRSISSDLVLGDPSLGGTHFRLHVGPTLRLEAVEKSLVLTGAGVIEPGHARLLDRGVEFRAGDIAMRLDVVCPPVEKPSTIWRRVAAAGAVLACAGSAAYAFAGRTPVQAMAVAPLPAALRTEAVALPDVAAMRTQLDRRHLGSVQVEALADGSYRASGTVAMHEVNDWRDIRRWLDEASAGRTVLVDRVAVAAAPPPLAIQSAWIGAQPYVIDGTGQKLFVGAVVANEWTIEGIEAGRVTMRRQGQHLAVTF